MSQLDLFTHQSINSNEAVPQAEPQAPSQEVERRRSVAQIRAPLVRNPVLVQKVEAEPLSEKAELAQQKQALWNRFFTNPCDETRNDLSLVYMPLVKMIAEGLKDKFPGHVDVNDLISTGYIGLLDAISKFDPSRDIKFESYSVMRIRGEILDSIRHHASFRAKSVFSRTTIVVP